MNKVKPGDPLKIPAATFNTLIDVARDFRAQQHNSSQSHRPPTPQGGIIPVRNDTGSDLAALQVEHCSACRRSSGRLPSPP
jgi:hypothetical protein